MFLEMTLESFSILDGKRQDKAGYWRLTNVPNYSIDATQAYAIDERMKQLGQSEQYEKELGKITRAADIPLDWASPDQRYRAAIKAVGEYGQVIP